MEVDVQLKKIISGGQTGADQAGLYAAEDCGLETGGWAPKFFRTDDGPAPELGTRFKLIETDTAAYRVRTRRNVEGADATLTIGNNFTSPGTKLTRSLCVELRRPYLEVHCKRPKEIDEVARWVEDNKVVTLNVAGNREAKAPGIFRFAREYVVEIVTTLRVWDASRRTLIYEGGKVWR